MLEHPSQETKSHFVCSELMQLSFQEHSSCAICDIEVFGLKAKKDAVWELTVQRCHVTHISPLLLKGGELILT